MRKNDTLHQKCLSIKNNYEKKLKKVRTEQFNNDFGVEKLLLLYTEFGLNLLM